jgi:hypothetical protein
MDHHARSASKGRLFVEETAQVLPAMESVSNGRAAGKFPQVDYTVANPADKRAAGAGERAMGARPGRPVPADRRVAVATVQPIVWQRPAGGADDGRRSWLSWSSSGG